MLPERIDLAGILVEDLPGVFEALERGLIDVGRAREIMVAPVSWSRRPGVAGRAGGGVRDDAYPWAGAGVAGPADRPDRPRQRRIVSTVSG